MDLHPEGSQVESYRKFLNSFFNVITILYTSRLKAPGLNPLNNISRVVISQYDFASVFMIILCLEDSNQEPSKW